MIMKILIRKFQLFVIVDFLMNILQLAFTLHTDILIASLTAVINLTAVIVHAIIFQLLLFLLHILNPNFNKNGNIN
jgi:hypothetical protein